MCSMTGHFYLAAQRQAEAARRIYEIECRAARHPIIQRIEINGKVHAVFRDGRILPVLERPTRFPKAPKMVSA